MVCGKYPNGDVLSLRAKYLTSQKYVDEVIQGDMIGDEVINFYLQRIKLRNERRDTLRSYPKLMVYTTYFYPLLVKNGVESSRPCHISRKAASPFDFDLLLIPIHNADRLHWTIIAVNTKTKIIEHYDSLNCGDDSRHIEMIQTFLAHEASKRKIAFDKNDWVGVIAQGPVQSNGLDCGAFICAWAAQRASDVDKQFIDFPHGRSAIKMFRRNLVCLD